MTMLAQKLNYDREVIRVWFCNKRQALKNTLKKLKQNEQSGGMESSDQSDAESPMNTSQTSTGGSQANQQNTTQQIIVSSAQGQPPQVISVLQQQQTVASALESAAQSAGSSVAAEIAALKQVCFIFTSYKILIKVKNISRVSG